MLDFPSLNLSGGPIGLFIGSFLASTLLPGGSEAMLLWALRQTPDQTALLWLTASLGNTLGGLSSWLIGWWMAKRFPRHGLKRDRQRQALALLARYGRPLLLLSWLPVIGDPLCLVAGWSGIGLLPASLYIGLGKAVRYASLIWVSAAIV